jgi:hypothetical protein
MWRLWIELKILLPAGTKGSEARKRGALSFAYAFEEIDQDAVHLVGCSAGGYVGFFGKPTRHVFFLHCD